MKTYELEFDEAALKEWRKLDGSIQTLFKKQLAKRLQARMYRPPNCMAI